MSCWTEDSLETRFCQVSLGVDSDAVLQPFALVQVCLVHLGIPLPNMTLVRTLVRHPLDIPSCLLAHRAARPAFGDAGTGIWISAGGAFIFSRRIVERIIC